MMLCQRVYILRTEKSLLCVKKVVKVTKAYNTLSSMIYGLSLRLFKVPDVPVLYIVVTDGLGDGDSLLVCDGSPLGL